MQIPNTMRAMLIHAYKQPLTKQTVPVPNVGANDVLVKVFSSSVNPVDFKIRDAKLKLLIDYPMPLILGNDFSGVVVAVGANVHKFNVGDAVFGRADKHRIGTFAEYIAICQDSVAKKPDSLTFNQAASLPLVALTAYQALHDVMRLKQGDKVLIHAGSGGVGTVAIQIAKAMGLYVATTASQAGRDLVARLGADLIIDYKTEDFSSRLVEYDGVLDTIGGESLKKSFKVVKKGATVVSVSALPTAKLAKQWQLPWYKVMLFSLVSLPMHCLARKYGVYYEFLFMRPSGAQLQKIAQWVEQGKITPVIDCVFDFEQAQKALEYSEQGRAKGKIIVQIQK